MAVRREIWRRWGCGSRRFVDLSALCRHRLKLAKGGVHGVRVGKAFHEIGRDEDYVRAFLYAVVVFAAHGLGKVELAGLERISFYGLNINRGVLSYS
jgi:hypothetical protein